MRFKLPIIIALILCLVSCDSPESVAEKALKEIGDGKYRFNMDKIFLGVNDDIFSLAFVHNAEAEDFLQGKKSDMEYKNLFFQTSCVFGEWKLVDKIEFPMDLHFASFRESAKQLGHEDWWNDHKELISMTYDSVGSEYDNKMLIYFSDDAIVEKSKVVRITRLRYKVDNSLIVVIDVLKSDKGFRVASFMWDE